MWQWTMRVGYAVMKNMVAAAGQIKIQVAWMMVVDLVR
jgi:hypothetical protein